VPITLTCVKCGTTVHVGGGNGKPPKPKKTPEEIAAKKAKREKNRPRIVRFIESKRIESDRGVGDTLERLLASVGGRKYKRLMSWLGASCGCEDRQAWLNKKYPYHGGNNGVTKDRSKATG
jgi:hypothetical protein